MLPNLNPDQLAAAYEFLRSLEPFNTFELPHADEVEFTVIASNQRHGHYQKKSKNAHEIAMSKTTNGHISTLIMFMAHEMIHLHQELNHTRNKNQHNAEFHRIALEVCAIQGYDYKLFV